jgi:CheY-like chemotaxis protein
MRFEPVYLPEDLRLHSPASAESTTTAATRATILLVEDDWQVRRVMERVLDRRGFRVVAASRGVDAVHVSDELLSEVDLLVTDVAMPGLDGPAVARALAARKPGLRALFVSGYADPAVVAESVAAMGGDFLTKPYTPDVLVARIRRLLASGPRL